MSLLARRLFLSLVAVLVAFVCAEGLVSFLFGVSLLGRPEMGPSLSEASLASRLATSPGLYRTHPDPLVGYVMREEASLEIYGGSIQTDHLGLRRRAGVPVLAGEDPLIVAVVGDSVAFGYGLDDDECLAHRLEILLNHARPDGERDVVCRTVAIPGWNTRNAVHFLLDHLDEIDPDLVLYLPVPNDLSDTDGVYESGHRRAASDPFSPDPLLRVSSGDVDRFQQELFKRQSLPIERSVGSLLNADISQEASRRSDEAADALSLLDETLASRGASLWMVAYRGSVFTSRLWLRLFDRDVSMPLINLLVSMPAEWTQVSNAHPNVAAVRHLATWLAEEVLQGDLITGEVSSLPSVPDEFSALRALPVGVTALRNLVAAQTKETLALIQPEVDFRTGRGTGQIYGGIHPNGVMGPRLLVALAGEGNALDVELASLEGQPDLYPLDVTVEVDGKEVGMITLKEGAVSQGRFAIPSASIGNSVLEVRLRAKTWALLDWGGRGQTASCVPVKLAMVKDV